MLPDLPDPEIHYPVQEIKRRLMEIEGHESRRRSRRDAVFKQIRKRSVRQDHPKDDEALDIIEYYEREIERITERKGEWKFRCVVEGDLLNSFPSFGLFIVYKLLFLSLARPRSLIVSRPLILKVPTTTTSLMVTTESR